MCASATRVLETTACTSKKSNSVTKMINDLRWKDQADRRSNICLTLFYKIVNHEVNVASDGIIIPMNRGTRQSQAHNTFIYIRSIIDNYKYSIYPRLKAMPHARAWMHQCLSYISIYTPDISCKSQSSSADLPFRLTLIICD